VEKIKVKITRVHQIELSSRCNLRCRYCVHPTMSRAKQDMDGEIWARALYWVKQFCDAGTQGVELNLCGIGESTLHPKFGEWALQARAVIGKDRRLILATNGVGVNEAHAEAMRLARVHVWVSLHRPEKAGPTVNLLRKYGVLAGVSADPSVAAVNWAGQVDWEVTAPRSPCPWLRQGWAFIAANGDVLRCCFDGNGTGKVGTVWGDLMQVETGAYSLCEKCHHQP
jgi:hypothetical protein